MDIDNDGHAPADDTLADQVANESEADERDERDEAEGTDGADEDNADAGDDAGDEDTSEDGEDEGDKPTRHKKPSGSERLKRRLERLQAENEALRSRAPQRAETITAADIRAEIGDPPREEDFGSDYAAFDRARVAYEIDARQTARTLQRRAAEAVNTERARIVEKVEAFRDECEDFAAKVPDFKATLQKAERDGVQASKLVERLIIESDRPAHLVYHLAKNPERLDRLNRMGEREALRELGRIESRLSAPKPRTETKAQKPVTPPKGGVAPRSPESDLSGWLKKTYG